MRLLVRGYGVLDGEMMHITKLLWLGYGMESTWGQGHLYSAGCLIWERCSLDCCVANGDNVRGLG